jgi:hypothetical protein
VPNTSAYNVADRAPNVHFTDRCTDDHFSNSRSDPLALHFIANIGTHQRAHVDSNSNTECGTVYSAICYAECSTNCYPDYIAIHHTHHITDRRTHQRAHCIPISCTKCATVCCADYRPNHLAIGYTYCIPDS